MTDTAATSQSAGEQASRRWNLDMMAAERDFPRGTPVDCRYAILSVPRSGSTLLARALRHTGLAGDPHEYLNPNAVKAWSALNGRPPDTLDDYLRDIEARRTSPNGYFGIKIHHRHLAALAGPNQPLDALLAGLLGRQHKIVFIHRRDRVAQAVSYFAARQTGLWTSEHRAHLPAGHAPDLGFDPVAISHCLWEIIAGEEGWRRALDERALDHLDIAYEDLVADYETVMWRVLSHLDLDQVSAIPAPPVTKTSDERSRRLADAFRHHLASSVDHEIAE